MPHSPKWNVNLAAAPFLLVAFAAVVLQGCDGDGKGAASGGGGAGAPPPPAVKEYDLGTKRDEPSPGAPRRERALDVHVIQQGDTVPGADVGFRIAATGVVGGTPADELKCNAFLGDSDVLLGSKPATDKVDATYRPERKEFEVRLKLPDPLPGAMASGDKMLWLRFSDERGSSFLTGIKCR